MRGFVRAVAAGLIGAVASAFTAHAWDAQATQSRCAKLLAAAEASLSTAIVDVTQKDELPPSGDKHDYMSVAPYYWPNPDSPTGLPWVNHDGKRNPAYGDFGDAHAKNVMLGLVRNCALGYHLCSDERFAQHAAKQLRAWFIAPPTRMNPNLRYAQSVPGRSQGSAWGIIDTANLGEVCDMAALLRGSEAWSPEDEAALKMWFRSYLDWLLGPEGAPEGKAPNNHGSWYDAQTAHFALYIGDLAYVRKACQRGKQRIDKLIEPDGRQPSELKRTKSWQYSLYNLQALFRLAQLGDLAGVDLWGYQSGDGGNLRAALDFLIPYALEPSSWPYEQIQPLNPEGLAGLLSIAAMQYHDQRYQELAEALGGSDFSPAALSVIPPPGYPCVWEDVTRVD